jgi:hypothetical protein
MNFHYLALIYYSMGNQELATIYMQRATGYWFAWMFQEVTGERCHPVR